MRAAHQRRSHSRIALPGAGIGQPPYADLAERTLASRTLGRVTTAVVLNALILGGGVEASPRLDALRQDLQFALAQFDEAQGIQHDHPQQARQLFRSAAQRLKSIVAAGVVNGRLEYNLGNCYLQAGEVGRAILHYRRAQRLVPGDDLLRNNLAVARSRCLTHVEPMRRRAVLESVFFWHYRTSIESRMRAALVAYVAFWASLLAWSIWRSPTGSAAIRNGHGSFLVAALVCAVVATASGLSAGISHWADRNAPGGVITAMDVSVYKGPGETYQRQFQEPLQPGVEFALRERRGDWWRIELADGKSGWVQAERAELIVNPDA